MALPWWWDYRPARARRHPPGVRREPAVAAVRRLHGRGWLGVAVLVAALVAGVVAAAPLAVCAIVALVAWLPRMVAVTATTVTVGPDWLLLHRPARTTWVDLAKLRSVDLVDPEEGTVTLVDRAQRTVAVDVRLLLATQPVRDALADGLHRSRKRGAVAHALATTLAQPLEGVAQVKLRLGPAAVLRPRRRRKRR